MKKPKLSDVWWMTATMLPVTTCIPPEGSRCYLSKGQVGLTSAEAKRHAFEHPGHNVVRQTVIETRYRLEPESAEDGAS